MKTNDIIKRLVSNRDMEKIWIFEKEGKTIWAYFKKDRHHEPMLMGYLMDENNRGYKVRTWTFTERKCDFFLHREDWREE